MHLNHDFCARRKKNLLTILTIDDLSYLYFHKNWKSIELKEFVIKYYKLDIEMDPIDDHK